ncbi:MAG: amino acid-binding ACT domain-containing protein [Acidobacteria bacterium]|nr:MAG: amino acid-binding ACT domain-containing protein [Acidobacteriota bacterium]
MSWDLEVELVNKPGTIADLGEAAAAAGVNISGICGVPCEGVGVMHVLVDDPDGAAGAFEAAGLTVQGRREVLVTSVENSTGELGSLARRFADAGVNVDLIYVASDNRLVLGMDDLDAGRGLI